MLRRWGNRRKRSCRGFTFAEVIVAIPVFILALLGTLMAYLAALQLIGDSEHTAQAMADAQVVLEQIRSEVTDAVTFTQVRSRTGPLWAQWVQALNLNNLNGEQVTVVPGLAADDPWPVTVQIQWLASGNRPRQATVHTLMTNRR